MCFGLKCIVVNFQYCGKMDHLFSYRVARHTARLRDWRVCVIGREVRGLVRNWEGGLLFCERCICSAPLTKRYDSDLS